MAGLQKIGVFSPGLLVCLAGVAHAVAETHRDTAEALFAGGGFWHLEQQFDAVAGVVETVVGFAGGDTQHPTYAQVATGTSGHLETVQVRFDPQLTDYATLLAHYWRIIARQADDSAYCRQAAQYQPVIFYFNADQQLAATASQANTAGARAAAVRIAPAPPFYAAEEYFQNYYLVHPRRFRFHEAGCNRAERNNAGAHSPHP